MPPVQIRWVTDGRLGDHSIKPSTALKRTRPTFSSALDRRRRIASSFSLPSCVQNPGPFVSQSFRRSRLILYRKQEHYRSRPKNCQHSKHFFFEKFSMHSYSTDFSGVSERKIFDAFCDFCATRLPSFDRPARAHTQKYP